MKEEHFTNIFQSLFTASYLFRQLCSLYLEDFDQSTINNSNNKEYSHTTSQTHSHTSNHNNHNNNHHHNNHHHKSEELTLIQFDHYFVRIDILQNLFFRYFSFTLNITRIKNKISSLSFTITINIFTSSYNSISCWTFTEYFKFTKWKFIFFMSFFSIKLQELY